MSISGVSTGRASQVLETEPAPDESSRKWLIQIEKVSKVFPADEADTCALAEVDLSVKHGEYVALTGPSGCGKSTLLSIMGLLDTPTSGRYSLDGRDVSKLTYTELAGIRNQQIGFIFQGFNLVEQMTIYENIALPLSYRRGMNTGELRDRVYASLARVGMEHQVKHYPAQLSGGQQQRVAVARALAGSPSILLADEPTGNLDSQNADAVMELIDSVHKDGATVCIVTHDSRFAACAERQVHLFDGRIKIPERLPIQIAANDAINQKPRNTNHGGD